MNVSVLLETKTFVVFQNGSAALECAGIRARFFPTFPRLLAVVFPPFYVCPFFQTMTLSNLSRWWIPNEKRKGKKILLNQKGPELLVRVTDQV